MGEMSDAEVLEALFRDTYPSVAETDKRVFHFLIDKYRNQGHQIVTKPTIFSQGDDLLNCIEAEAYCSICQKSMPGELYSTYAYETILPDLYRDRSRNLWFGAKEDPRLRQAQCAVNRHPILVRLNWEGWSIPNMEWTIPNSNAVHLSAKAVLWYDFFTIDSKSDFELDCALAAAKLWQIPKPADDGVNRLVKARMLIREEPR